MRIALVDNGSLEPSAHEGLRRAAAAIGRLSDATVEAVSWKHSNRIAAAALGGRRAATLVPWVTSHVLAGERDFVIIPFFISAQGAIGSSLRADLDALRSSADFGYTITGGLSEGTVLSAIVSERVRAVSGPLGRPAVVVVDHGGPSPTSAALRNRVAAEARANLGVEVSGLEAASMESPDGGEFGFNQPLLADLLRRPGFNEGNIMIAPLFLLPGRHAGPGGDLARIALEAESESPRLRCHFTDLVGSHPAALSCLATALTRALGVASPS